MEPNRTTNWRASAWPMIFGVLVGLLAAGGIWLAASLPRGEALHLLPPPAAAELTVHVSGAVSRPGVYQLPRQSRVEDAIQAAGGLLADGDDSALNLAAPLEDGVRLYIPRQGETATILPRSAEVSSAGRININTASKAELESLPRIGPVIAQAILDYRQAHGPFASPEAIQEVDGIGPGIYEQIKDLIGVGE